MLADGKEMGKRAGHLDWTYLWFFRMIQTGIQVQVQLQRGMGQSEYRSKSALTKSPFERFAIEVHATRACDGLPVYVIGNTSGDILFRTRERALRVSERYV